MKNYSFLDVLNSQSVSFDDIPVFEANDFRNKVIDAVNNGRRKVSALFGIEKDNMHQVIAILSNARLHRFELASFMVKDSYESFTTEAACFEYFERELHEDTGIVPLNHPNLKPVRKLRNSGFFQMAGDAVHEVAVGPIHAGVIEPGHFRFQCMGEKVYFLEIALGYQHRGVEKRLVSQSGKLLLPQLETCAGDTSIAHALCGCSILESLGNIEVPEDARILRAVALELERLANHIGDLGALSGDVAFLPTASFCGRIRGEYLNMTAALCGNRFGRHYLMCGGTHFGLTLDEKAALLKHLETVYPQLLEALDLLFNSPTVLDRFENTGVVSNQTATTIGLVGTAARASGIICDARWDYPLPGMSNLVPQRSEGTGNGDVMARAKIRYEEIKASHEFLFNILRNRTINFEQSGSRVIPSLSKNSICLAAVEAWRGKLLHVAITDNDGKLAKYKIVDPSFHNWNGLAHALRGEEISNFPICNKSFNLSYCGHDL